MSAGAAAPDLRRALLIAGLSSLLIGWLVWTLLPTSGSFALWSSGSSLNGGTVSSGQLAIRVGNGSTQTAAYAFDELAGSALAPGSWAQAPLTVSNGGDAPFTYRLSQTSATDPTGLASAMLLLVQQVSAAGSCPSGVGAAGATAPLTLYSGVLVGGTIPTARPLASGAREVLCLRVTLQPSAPTSLQGGSTRVTFTFTAVSS